MSEFRHRQAAHCESGVTAALLAHRGLELSEPMTFGIGGGLYFFFPPFVKVMGMPLISFRSYPGTLFGRAAKRLGVRAARRSFSSEAKGVRALDELLAAGVPVGLKTNMFWLSYFPREFRSQFNGHNLIALERRDDGYLLSDPMLEEPVEIDAEALERSRFAKGVLAPRGGLYYPLEVPERVDLVSAAAVAIKNNARRMLDPVPMVGANGIRRLARAVRSWPRLGERRAKLLIGHVIRMQEEVGSGGAGFRYMYAAFLQEAGELSGHAPWLAASEEMTAIGDLWRNEFAVTCGRIIKGRDRSGESYESAARVLEECSRRERDLFRGLLKDAPRPGRSKAAVEATAGAR